MYYNVTLYKYFINKVYDLVGQPLYIVNKHINTIINENVYFLFTYGLFLIIHEYCCSIVKE